MEQAFADNAFALAEDTEVDDDDLETIDVWGWPALLSALSRGQFDLAISILNKGASLAAVTPGGLTSLHLVCGAAGQRETPASVAMLDLLLQRGVDVHALDKQLKTALYYACMGNAVSAKRLLDGGARPNEGEGDSPLLRCVTLDNKEMAEMLLAAGARDDGAYRKALQMKGACVGLGPLMASASRVSIQPANQAPDDVVMPDSMLLLPPPPDSNCRIVWGSSHPAPARIKSLSEFYRLRCYEKQHVVFCGKNEDGSEVGIVAVGKWPDHANQCLVVYIIKALEYELVQHSQVQDAAVFVAERRPKMTWEPVPEGPAVHLKSHVLGIESKLSRRTLNVAVVFASMDQWRESDMFDTPMQPSHRELMLALGEEVEIDNTWAGQHNGGLPLGKRAYYTSFRGFEICMHVASLLSTDERRQFLGNDKVILYICDESVAKPIVPRFRGEVNSVALVVQKRDDGWKMACFCRERVSFSPTFPGRVMDKAELRSYLLATVIDAQAAVMASPPYCDIVGRVVQDMVRSVWPDLPTVAKKERPKSAHFRSRSSSKNDVKK